MIVLLSYSTSWSKNSSCIPSTGGLSDTIKTTDSVKVAYDDLRKVNVKLVERKYYKEVNVKLNNIIHNDSIIIDNYKQIVSKKDNTIKQVKSQRNIAIGSSIGAIILLIISLIK